LALRVEARLQLFDFSAQSPDFLGLRRGFDHGLGHDVMVVMLHGRGGRRRGVRSGAGGQRNECAKRSAAQEHGLYGHG